MPRLTRMPIGRFRNSMVNDAKKKKALEKLAYGFSPTVGVSYPPPTVGNVLDSIGLAQAHGIGTSSERRDAFGRIIDSGLVNTSPAGNALKMIGGGILGRAVTGMVTNRPFLKGLGAGIGALLASNKW